MVLEFYALKLPLVCWPDLHPSATMFAALCVVIVARALTRNKHIISSPSTISWPCGSRDAGNDTVNAGEGKNFVYGGAYTDNLTTGQGDDTICGDACQLQFADSSTPLNWVVDSLVAINPTDGGEVSCVHTTVRHTLFCALLILFPSSLGDWLMRNLSGFSHH